MKSMRLLNTLKGALTGVIMLQAGGCDTTFFFDVVQTVLLGVTAAGGFAILQNI